MSGCIFCKIVSGDIPAKKVYEDGEFLAFYDANPVARVHFMIIPKHHVASLLECDAGYDEEMLGRLLLLAPRLAKEQGLQSGFKTTINTGKDGGQAVFHLHVHVYGGGKLSHLQ